MRYAIPTNFSLADESDDTKVATFSAEDIGTGTSKKYKFPNYEGYLAVPADEGAAGKVLTSAGTGAQPTWETPAAGGQAFPVGAVFMAVVSTNPGTLLGYGTWSQIAAGRVLVGQDSGDTDFDTPEETGGAKTVASSGTNAAEAAHTHSVTSNVAVGDHATVNPGAGGAPVPSLDAASAAHSVTNNAVTSGAGSSHTHAFTGDATSVVQPYFVVYIWKRTA